MPNDIQTGDSIFADDLARRMGRAGLTISQLASDTGIDASTIRKYLMIDGTRHCAPSRESWARMAERLPGLYKPKRFNFEWKPDGAGSGSRQRRAKGRAAPEVVLTRRAPVDDRAIVVVDGRAYFEGDEPKAVES